MSIASFTDFLEAKRAADERSRDHKTFELFLHYLRSTPKASVLDAGTGTGAMARRLVAALPDADCEVIGLDTDCEAIAVADSVSKEYDQRRLSFACHSLFDAQTDGLVSTVSAVTAHSFVDEFPPAALLQAFRRLLGGQGMVYTSLTYNGRTEFFPQSQDEEYENRMLALYDRSMDERTFEGKPIAGSRGASRFLAAAEQEGFGIVSFGGSDWCIQPRSGEYRRGDAVLLEGMVDFVANESLRHDGMDAERTEAWRTERKTQIREQRLRLLVHHVDSLIEL